jgi:hypothetical protein
LTPVVIAGDTTGGAAFAYLMYGKPDVDGTTRKHAVLLIASTTHVGVQIWGHGSKGTITVGIGEQLTPDDIRTIAKLRKKQGLPKLEFIEINQCHSCQSPELINACLELADEVRGHEGWTVDPHNNLAVGELKTWRKPVSVEGKDNAGAYRRKPSGRPKRLGGSRR